MSDDDYDDDHLEDVRDYTIGISKGIPNMYFFVCVIFIDMYIYKCDYFEHPLLFDYFL